MSPDSLILLQIVPWTRLDHQFEVTLPIEDSKTADSGPNAHPKHASKTVKPAVWIYPLTYAIELRQPTWLVPMVNSAKACFLLDAEQIDGRLLETSYPEAAAQRNFSPKAAQLGAQKMSDWVNAAIGADNPPTALYRCHAATGHAQDDMSL